MATSLLSSRRLTQWLLVAAVLSFPASTTEAALRTANRTKWEIDNMHRGRLQHHQKEQSFRNLQQINHNPRFGKIKVLVLLIQFTDHVGRNLIDKSVIQELWSGQIKDWFTANSQGLYEVEPVVTDWIVTDNTEAFYADGQSGFTTDLQKAMYPALSKLDADGWDWSEYDFDGNGRIDSVVMLHSGISAVAGEEDCFGRGRLDRIWPHAFTSSLSYNTWNDQEETVGLSGYTVNSVYDALCDDIPLTAGLTVHEYMHTMNLIDLYDATDLYAAKGVGSWDIMGHPYGADNSGTPGLLGAWMKKEVGWVDPILITADGDYVSKPAHTHLEAYMIDITPEDGTAPEYLLIENRQPIGFEANIGGSGLLIWHIDDAADDMKNRGYPGQPGWPQNGNHYQVAILPKDGNYDLEQNVNIGDPGDLFAVGDALTPGNGGQVYPNTDSYQGGKIVDNGFTIEVISEDESGEITFRISGLMSSAIPELTTAPEVETTTPVPPATSMPITGTTTATPPTAQPTSSSTRASPPPQPATTPATPAPVSPGSPTPQPTDPSRWILSRPPGPTRAPFELPEFPYLKPLEILGDLAEDDAADSKANILLSKWNGSILLGMALTLLGLIV